MTVHQNILSGRLFGIALLSGVFLSSSCLAQEVVAGWEGNSFSGNGGVSAAFSIPLSMNSAIILRPSTSYLYYDVRQIGLTTRVTAPALAFGVGYRYFNDRVTFDIGPAIQVLWEERKIVGGMSTSKTLIGAGIGSSLSFLATPTTNLNFAAAYDQANRYFSSRAGIKQRITDLNLTKPWWIALGAEAIAQGNYESQQVSGGGLAEMDFDQGRSAVQLRAGYSWFTYPDHSKLERPYLGAGVYHRF